MDEFAKLQTARRIYAPRIARLTRESGIKGTGRDVSIGPRYVSMSFSLANPLQISEVLKLAEPMALATGTEVVIAQRDGGLVSFQFQLAERDWQPVSLGDLKRGPGIVGMGLGDRKKQVNFEFARPHCLIAGATGAGKSVTVQTLVIGLCLGYSPAQLSLVIVDPDADHERFRNVAHLAGLPIARDDAQIDRALTYANSEFTKRAAGNLRDSARLVVVIDEAERVLANPKRLAIATTIAKGGRKFNVNLVVSTQDPSEHTLPDLVGQLGNRFIGQVDNAHTSAHLSGQAGLNCHKLTGKGDFQHVYGQLAERLLVALPQPGDFDALPRAALPEPEFDEVEPVELGPAESESKGRGRPADPLSYELIGRMIYHLGRAAGLSNGTLAHKLKTGESKVTRHRDAANQILAGLKAEYAAVSKSLNP